MGHDKTLYSSNLLWHIFLYNFITLYQSKGVEFSDTVYKICIHSIFLKLLGIYIYLYILNCRHPSCEFDDTCTVKDSEVWL